MASFGGAGNRKRVDVESAPHCPRCASSNTKFCYFNNYSLSQPRYFCKSCRRYWTKGGALRNVPVGGGCRKTRRPAKKDVLPPPVDNDPADRGGGFAVPPVSIPMTSCGIDGGKGDAWGSKINGGDDLIHNQGALRGETPRQSNSLDFGYPESAAQIQDYELVWHDDDQPLFSSTWEF